MKAPLNKRKGIPGRKGRKAPSPKLSTVGRVQRVTQRGSAQYDFGKFSRVGVLNRLHRASTLRSARRTRRQTAIPGHPARRGVRSVSGRTLARKPKV